MPGSLRRAVFGISPDETTFARRGFHSTDPRTQRRLEQIGRTFVHGYHLGLSEPRPDPLARRLADVDRELRGFAFEGAAMALALLDHLTPWHRGRLRALLAGAGDAHAYMVHVGAGWAAARLPWVRRNIERQLSKLDPLIGWLTIDGYGFHEGYFHGPRYFRGRRIPPGLSSPARRVFDQGLGRSLWFVAGADVARITTVIGDLAPDRRADLWGGLGLASAYAGELDRAAAERLRSAAGDHLPHVAQGAAFAAKARERAGNPAPHTELACEVFCRMSASAAAAATDRGLVDRSDGGAGTAYECWRRATRERLAAAAIGTRGDDRSAIISTASTVGRRRRQEPGRSAP